MNRTAIAIIFGMLVFAGTCRADALIVDHNAAQQFGSIPPQWIEKAKRDFNVSYGHTSHGSQIATGMSLLKNDAAYGSLYNFSDNYSSALPAGALSFWDTRMSGADDLGAPNRTAWETATRNHLNGIGGSRNMVMWAWCGQVSTAAAADISTYLSLMSGLEADYPNVTFVYMTGHLDGTGPNGNLYLRNNQIRDYCRNNGKVLFDFADIESWSPAGTYYPNESDACNWCSAWCGSNSCPSCSCAHSQCFNCQLKGRAFWWMMARLAGWDGQPAAGCTQDSECGSGKLCCGGICVAPACSASQDCSDQNSATLDTCQNQASCSAACSRTPITSCTSGDAYCPPGCTPALDSDCTAACGNGVKETGENCTTCPQDVPCTAGQTCSSGTCVPQLECVSMQALMNYISQWKSGGISMAALMQKIAGWKSGAGCG